MKHFQVEIFDTIPSSRFFLLLIFTIHDEVCLELMFPSRVLGMRSRTRQEVTSQPIKKRKIHHFDFWRFSCLWLFSLSVSARARWYGLVKGAYMMVNFNLVKSWKWKHVRALPDRYRVYFSVAFSLFSFEQKEGKAPFHPPGSVYEEKGGLLTGLKYQKKSRTLSWRFILISRRKSGFICLFFQLALRHIFVGILPKPKGLISLIPTHRYCEIPDN